MKIIYKMRLLSLICIIISIGLGTSSCKKDTNLNSGKVELLSFGPAGVQHGEQIKFIGSNLDKVTTIKFVGDSIPSSAFISKTSDLIVVVVPEKAERGLVTLKTPEGDVVSKTELDFLVLVTITSVTFDGRPGDNITIKGNYMNWIKEIWFTKDLVVRDSDFVSKSLSQIVLKVPVNAKTGPLTINTGGTKPMTVTSTNDLVILLPAVTSFGPIPVDRGANLTITGTNLDLTKQILLKGVTDPIKSADFISKSATEIVIKVPETTTKGVITLVAYSDVQVVSTQKLLIVGDLPDLAPLAYAFYEDNLMNGWSDWGWGGARDKSNTENVRDGDKSYKISCDGSWGALYLGGGNVSLANYTQLTFSLFGNPGTNGKVLKVIANWGTSYDITIQEGKWVEYKLTMANIGNPAKITDLVFQEAGWVGVYYLDHVGLR